MSLLTSLGNNTGTLMYRRRNTKSPNSLNIHNTEEQIFKALHLAREKGRTITPSQLENLKAKINGQKNARTRRGYNETWKEFSEREYEIHKKNPLNVYNPRSLEIRYANYAKNPNNPNNANYAKKTHTANTVNNPLTRRNSTSLGSTLQNSLKPNSLKRTNSLRRSSIKLGTKQRQRQP